MRNTQIITSTWVILVFASFYKFLPPALGIWLWFSMFITAVYLSSQLLKLLFDKQNTLPISLRQLIFSLIVIAGFLISSLEYLRAFSVYSFLILDHLSIFDSPPVTWGILGLVFGFTIGAWITVIKHNLKLGFVLLPACFFVVFLTILVFAHHNFFFDSDVEPIADSTSTTVNQSVQVAPPKTDSIQYERKKGITKHLIQNFPKTDSIQYERGMYLYNQKKYIEALPFFDSSAMNGNPKAECMLGTMYFLGEGVEKNFYTAYSWYEKSASKRNEVAMYMMGGLYSKGTVVKRDKNRARYYMRWVIDSAKKPELKRLARLFLK